MPRLPRIVISGLSHHVTQRGNRRQRTFFEEADYRTYLDLMGRSCRAFAVDLVAYCLMPNHVHLIAVPAEAAALSRAIGSGHEAYSKYLNFKHGWQGYLWQGRFHSNVMDETHFPRAVQYVELNPVRARLVGVPEAYPWSSVRGRLGLMKDPILNPSPTLNEIGNWRTFLASAPDPDVVESLRKNAGTGRPIGSAEFLRSLEQLTGLSLLPKKRGRKGKENVEHQIPLLSK